MVVAPKLGSLAIAAAVAVAACRAVPRPRLVVQGPPVEVILPALDGGEIDVSGYRDRVLVLHFFTTWSLSAQADLVELGRAERSARPGSLAIVGVALDLDGARLITPWRDAAGVSHSIALATDEVRAGDTAFGRVDVVPTTIVLDRDGQIVWRHEGGLPPGELARLVGILEAPAQGP